MRGGTYPDLTAEQLNQLAAKDAAWWKDLRDPLFHKETNFENLIIPEMQLQRYQDLDELATLYGFDSVLLRTVLKLTSQQLDVFLNEYAPNARTSLGEDDRAFNMKAMTLIRKIRSKLDKAAGEVEWFKHANPREPRDYDARVSTSQTTRDTPHSVDDHDTILLKSLSYEEAMTAWETWPQRAGELSIAKLGDAITYIFHKHEESGKEFNKAGWRTNYPDRYLWNVEEGRECLTKLNRCLWMKLYLIRPSILSFMLELEPFSPAQNVDAMVGAVLQGGIKLARRHPDIDADEKERLQSRKRSSREVVFQPCRDYPNKCKKEDGCKYVHATR